MSSKLNYQAGPLLKEGMTGVVFRWLMYTHILIYIHMHVTCVWTMRQSFVRVSHHTCVRHVIYEQASATLPVICTVCPHPPSLYM